MAKPLFGPFARDLRRLRFATLENKSNDKVVETNSPQVSISRTHNTVVVDYHKILLDLTCKPNQPYAYWNKSVSQSIQDKPS